MNPHQQQHPAPQQQPGGPYYVPTQRHRKTRTGRTVLLALILVMAGTVVGLAAGIPIGLAASTTTDQHAASTRTPHPSTDNTPDATPTSEPTPDDTSDGPAMLEVGDSMDVYEDSAATTTATITVAKVTSRTGPKDTWSDGPQNGRFLIFTLTIECTKGKFHFAADDFYVRTKDSDRYNTGDGNAWQATSRQQLDYSTINGGERKAGPVAFDSSRRHGQLVYDPNMSGQPIAVWTF